MCSLKTEQRVFYFQINFAWHHWQSSGNARKNTIDNLPSHPCADR